MTAHPRLVGELADGRVIADAAASWPISGSEVRYESRYATVRTDRIVDTSSAEHDRLVVQPHGAVGVLALDEQDRVLLVQQYRHPVQMRLLELPAGILDVAGESPLDAAKRELAEEADINAATWQPLYEAYGTPGYSTERWHCFVATELGLIASADRTDRVAEEADLQQWWVPVDEALNAAADGRISDAKTLAGLWGLHALRTRV